MISQFEFIGALDMIMWRNPHSGLKAFKVMRQGVDFEKNNGKPQHDITQGEVLLPYEGEHVNYKRFIQ